MSDFDQHSPRTRRDKLMRMPRLRLMDLYVDVKNVAEQRAVISEPEVTLLHQRIAQLNTENARLRNAQAIDFGMSAGSNAVRRIMGTEANDHAFVRTADYNHMKVKVQALGKTCGELRDAKRELEDKLRLAKRKRHDLEVAQCAINVFLARYGAENIEMNEAMTLAAAIGAAVVEMRDPLQDPPPPWNVPGYRR